MTSMRVLSSAPRVSELRSGTSVTVVSPTGGDAAGGTERAPAGAAGGTEPAPAGAATGAPAGAAPGATVAGGVAGTGPAGGGNTKAQVTAKAAPRQVTGTDRRILPPRSGGSA